MNFFKRNKKKKKKYEVRVSKIRPCTKKSNTKSNMKKNARIKKNQFQGVTTKPITDKQTNNWPTILFETEY